MITLNNSRFSFHLRVKNNACKQNLPTDATTLYMNLDEEIVPDNKMAG